MKTLSILRHAKSSWDQPSLEDFYRPLNQRGLKNAPMMGRWLRQQPQPPEMILTSPAIRAWTTAHMVAAQLFDDIEPIASDKRIYEASVETLLTVLQHVDNQVNHLLLVGHNPGLTELANSLGSEFIANLPTCAVCRIDLPLDHWAQIGSVQGKTQAIDLPRVLAKQFK